MNRKMQRGVGDGPDDSERMEEYWDGNQQEMDVPWSGRGTGRSKSKSKGKERNDRHRSMPDTLRDEFVGDSDLE